MTSYRPVLALVTLIAAGCGGGGGGGTPTAPPMQPPAGPPVTFSDFQAQIFTPTCARGGCHSAASAQAGLVLEPGVAHGNLVGVPSTEVPALLRVDPGDAEQSYLIHKLRGDAGIIGERMPRGGPFLGQAEIDAMIAWINSGASGQLKVPEAGCRPNAPED